MQCKDIPTVPVLEFLAYCAIADFQKCGRWGTWLARDDGTLFENSVQHAMPENVQPKLALAKVGALIRRGFVDGCACGCRGDFELTEKGRAHLASAATGVPAAFDTVQHPDIAAA